MGEAANPPESVDPVELMDLHMRALFQHDDQDRLLRVNEPDGAPAPRFFLGRTAAGHRWRFRPDVPPAVVDRLDELARSEPALDDLPDIPRRLDEMLAALDARGDEGVWCGPVYRFPGTLPVPVRTREIATAVDLLRPHFSDWIGDVGICVPLVVRVLDGAAVSLCASVRITAAAHEAGVETAPAFRRQGHATAAVSAWAAAVRRRGRVPLYSTSWSNAASIAVAKALGMVQYGVTLHIA